MKIISLICMFVLISAVGFSATIYVPDDFPTIQEAIDAAIDGDTVLVKPDTYVENIDFKGKAFTLVSEQGPDITVIDGNQTGRVVTCQSGEGPDSVLDGFTIQNGLSYSVGGGMYIDGSNPTVTNCTFSENRAGHANYDFGFGGGMYNNNSSPEVTNCTFSGNTAFGYSSGSGGGMCNSNSSPTLTNCTFSGNSASSVYFSHGGGMYNSYSNPKMTNCTFFENEVLAMHGSSGGGMDNSNSHPTVSNCTFTANWAGDDGNGMSNSDSNPTVTNCIFWNSYDEIYNCGTSSPIVTYTCINGGYPGTGNIDADPLFLDPLNDDFHLTWLSPCINRGTNDGAPSVDIDGDPRPYMGTVDMGADEFVGTHSMAADVFSLSELTGGTVNFNLTGGSDNNGRSYIVLGGVTGTAPGTPLPGGLETLRLNWDVFTDFVVSVINTPLFLNFMGTLDTSGMGTAQLNAPPIPGFAGVTMHYAYALNNPWDFVSNPVAVEIVQ